MNKLFTSVISCLILTTLSVIPLKRGIQLIGSAKWIPASAGMTKMVAGMTIPAIILYSLFFILVPTAHAATVTWDGGASGSWDGTNITSGGSITINNAGTLTQNNKVQ